MFYLVLLELEFFFTSLKIDLPAGVTDPIPFFFFLIMN